MIHIPTFVITLKAGDGQIFYGVGSTRAPREKVLYRGCGGSQEGMGIIKSQDAKTIKAEPILLCRY